MEYDFILALGDDRTDEDMFELLADKENCYTIKVGNQAWMFFIGSNFHYEIRFKASRVFINIPARIVDHPRLANLIIAARMNMSMHPQLRADIHDQLS